MRRVLLGIIVSTLFVFSVSAQTAEQIVSNYIKTIGGMEKLQSVKTLRKVGKFNGGGGLKPCWSKKTNVRILSGRNFLCKG